MTITDAINDFKDKAQACDVEQFQHAEAAEHRQMVEWLEELKLSQEVFTRINRCEDLRTAKAWAYSMMMS